MSMEFEPAFEFGPAFFEALLKHALTLEVLRLEGECYADAEGMGRLLWSAPNLTLRAIIRTVTTVDISTPRSSWIRSGSAATMWSLLVRSEAFPDRKLPESSTVDL